MGNKSDMREKYLEINNLKVSETLFNFVNNEVLKDTEISSKDFWIKFDKIVHELAPRNKELIEIRNELQKNINEWHIKNKGNQININDYKKFLEKLIFKKIWTRF